jgi:rhodanese-related sulfurtransferase
LGLTRIRLSQYVVASAVAMIPGTVAYTWLGHAGREVAAGSETAVRNVLLALGLLAVVAFLPRLVRRFRRNGPRWIDVRQLRTQLDQGEQLLVIDVRGPDEFGGPLGHVPAAINIPLPELGARIGELEASKRRSIAIVCRTDKRSAKAAELLIEADFADVAIVRGGMEHWQREGFVVAGATTG